MNTYQICDLNLAAAVIASGIPVEKIEKSNTGKGTFIFEHSEELLKFVDDFYKNQARVCPLRMSQAAKNLKNALYNTNLS